MARKQIEAIAYLRTSSSTNVGSDKDSDKRQRAAIAAFARSNGFQVVGEFYDEAVSGSDPVTDVRASRPCWTASLATASGQS